MILSQSFLNFVYSNKSQSKVCRFLFAVHCNEKHPVIGRAVGDSLDYLTNRPNGCISYLPKGKPLMLSDSGEWKRNGRQEGKPARTIQRLLSPTAKRLFNPSDWEKFSSLYNGTFESCGEVRLLPITEIAKVYNPDSQSFGGTCMQGDEEQDFLKFYTQAPDRLQLVVLYEGEELHARALVWNIDGTLYVDRIYGKEKHVERVKAFMWSMGAVVKQSQSYTNKLGWEDSDGNTFERVIRFDYPTEDVDLFPYLDTFTYGGDGWLSNEQTADCLYQYTDTGGNRSGDDRPLIDGVRYSLSQCRWSSYNDSYILWDEAVQVNGGWYREDQVERRTYLVAPDGEQEEE